MTADLSTESADSGVSMRRRQGSTVTYSSLLIHKILSVRLRLPILAGFLWVLPKKYQVGRVSLLAFVKKTENLSHFILSIL
jgi:hypothetical protein